MEPGPVLDRSGNQRNPAIRLVAFILTQPGSSIDTLASVTDGQLSGSRPAERTSRLQRPRGILCQSSCRHLPR